MTEGSIRYAQVLQWLVDNGWEWNQDDLIVQDVDDDDYILDEDIVSVIDWARARGYPVDILEREYVEKVEAHNSRLRQQDSPLAAGRDDIALRVGGQV